MPNPVKAVKFVEAPQLTLKEKHQIDRKVEFETAKSFHSMITLGAFANMLSAFLYVLAVYNATIPTLILSWYALLAPANLINIVWAFRFEYSNITRKEILKCRRGFFYILIFICLIWSSIGILFMNDDIISK
ncbi:MAG: hypothetical protein ACRCXC_01015 [Legionella sp.]